MDMNDITTCPYRDAVYGCVYCCIEHCPYDYKEETEETESSQKPALLIFRCTKMCSPGRMKKTRDDIITQVKEGVVLLPARMTVEAIVPADCEIRIVDTDGNVVEGGKMK